MTILETHLQSEAARRWLQRKPPLEREGSLARALPELAQVLKEEQVEVLELHYEGRAGVGDFTLVRCIGVDRRAMTWVLPDEQRSQVRAVLTIVRDSRFPRWRALEGACGCFAWDVKNDVLEHRHSTRFIEYETSFTYGL